MFVEVKKVIIIDDIGIMPLLVVEGPMSMAMEKGFEQGPRVGRAESCDQFFNVWTRAQDEVLSW